MPEAKPIPPISVVVLNYNGRAWMRRCLESLQAQTIFRECQVVVADNTSTDGSDKLAEELLKGWRNGLFVQNGANLGFCEGNNRGAKVARGEFLLFLNNDTWLEPDCLERLVEAARVARADAASPLVLNYEDGTFQTNGAAGFDVCGYLTGPTTPLPDGPIFCAPGCAFLIRTEVFWALGGFDSHFFMYADETDLAWRLALGGYSSVAVASARLHHRGAAAANPLGGAKIVEYRTSDFVRYQVTRNSLLVLFKNAQNLLLLLVPLQLSWVLLEALAVVLLTRDAALVKRVYLHALRDCWLIRGHIAAERCRLKTIRRRNDLQMLRFFRIRLGRWPEIRRVFTWGLPRISAKQRG